MKCINSMDVDSDSESKNTIPTDNSDDEGKGGSGGTVGHDLQVMCPSCAHHVTYCRHVRRYTSNHHPFAPSYALALVVQGKPLTCDLSSGDEGKGGSEGEGNGGNEGEGRRGW